ncbi:MAG: type II secretion system F family protein [Selenomonadaceae bacterium]|nr:type II secretion system F family protein [Selenomonadaceae bacterium]MBQ4404385.1 type II secretion system F family protein [Selenomonadaceae bacterium]
MLISFVAVTCGLAVVVILFLVRTCLARYHINLFNALRFYVDKEPPPQTFMDYKAVKWTVALVKKIAAILPQTSFFAKLNVTLRRAGLPLLGSEFVVAVALTSILGGLIVLAITLNSTAAVMTFAAIVATEIFLLKRQVSKRRELFVNQLSDCLTTVANSLRAGFSFVQAMDLVSKEMEPPISDEFAHVMRDISYGMILDEALEDMDKRVGSYDFHLVVTAVLIQREIGGNLAHVLDSISQTITERIRMRREILTLTAQGRMSSWLVSLLPIFIAGAMLLISPTHFDETLASPIGRIALGVAAVMAITGFIVIRKIVAIKVE